MQSNLRLALGLAASTLLLACASSSQPVPPAPSPAAPASPAALDFPSPENFSGFDARRAYQHVEKIVSFGPRPPASEGSRRTHEYLQQQLAAFGCIVEEDSFEAGTPRGRLRMKNVTGKAPGQSEKIILLLSHFDTRIVEGTPGFVGANDGGSSTGIVLELARQLCARKSAVSYWFGFVDGEEAFGEWSDINGTFGSRQMAAKLAASGDLKRVGAVVLLDLVGEADLGIKRESNSTRWLTDILWTAAARLGYQKEFLAQETPVEDDHLPFLRRNVPAVDVIDLDYAHWHTARDTLDKISPRSLAVVGHVVLESLPAIEKRIVR